LLCRRHCLSVFVVVIVLVPHRCVVVCRCCCCCSLLQLSVVVVVVACHRYCHLSPFDCCVCLQFLILMRPTNQPILCLRTNDTPHRRNRTCRACREGSCEGGGVLLGWTTAYYLVKGTQGVNCIVAAGGKWLGRSIFVVKTNLGGRFWRRSGTHDARQRATTSLKLGETHVNVA